MSDTACPSCGAPLPTRNPGVVVAACEYCGTAVTWDADAVQNSGRRSRLPQGFTRLYTGATGTVDGQRFVVLGRVRYGTDRAFWDEWCCRLDDDGSTVWITEDDHELAAESGRGVVYVSPQVRPGEQVEVLERSFVIEETGEATCLGIEGQLPREVLPGEVYRYADGTTPDGRESLGLEWDRSDGNATAFVGRWVDNRDLALDDEGLEW